MDASSHRSGFASTRTLPKSRHAENAPSGLFPMKPFVGLVHKAHRSDKAQAREKSHRFEYQPDPGMVRKNHENVSRNQRNVSSSSVNGRSKMS
jgi:hypothetical protein